MPQSLSAQACVMPTFSCAHGVCYVWKRFLPMHMAYSMCIETPPPCTSKSCTSARFTFVRVILMAWWVMGAIAITTTRVHLNSNMCTCIEASPTYVYTRKPCTQVILMAWWVPVAGHFPLHHTRALQVHADHGWNVPTCTCSLLLAENF